MIGVDYVPGAAGDGPAARHRGARSRQVDDVPEAVRELTGGRGTDSVIDAVGMEAHGITERQDRQELDRPAARRRRAAALMKRRASTGCRALRRA